MRNNAILSKKGIDAGIRIHTEGLKKKCVVFRHFKLHFSGDTKLTVAFLPIHRAVTVPSHVGSRMMVEQSWDQRRQEFESRELNLWDAGTLPSETRPTSVLHLSGRRQRII